MIEIAYRVRVEEVLEGKQVLIAPGAMAKRRARSKPPRAHPFVGLFGWVLFIGLAVVFYVVAHKDSVARPVSTRVNAQTNHSLWAAMAFASGIAAMIVALLIIHRLRRGIEQRDLDRIQTWVLDGDGIEQVAGAKRTRWKWTHFSSFAETDTLFVLRESPQVGKVLPKRLFANDTVVGNVRALLVEKLAIPVAAVNEGTVAVES